ncbi:hypothetical protein FSARC_4220 [Fusarium sarcochroum]|uniref:RING-type domain-containing protein n=1 Tax=Fusarium sarcochroum TaxID=1208366 RepID=A0A8H4U2Q4_9HYPO|nr:hypothetical protein FSARC_4220 [Fusarium sarcochroum]
MDPITDTYWPVFKQAAEADVDKVRPIQLTCIICQELMTTSPSEPNHYGTRGSSHAAWIMPCGHIFGRNCLAEWLKHAKEPGRKYHKCPVCSTKLHHHPDCGHSSVGRMIPDTVGTYSQIPPLLSAGGIVAPKCGRCEIKRALDQIAKYTKIYGTPKPELQQDQCVGFSLCIEDLAETRTTYPVPLPGATCRRVRDLEIPGEFLAVWNIIKQTLALKATRFFYDVDLGAFELAISVYESVPSSPGEE